MKPSWHSKKLERDSYSRKADLQAQIVVVEELPSAKRARVERLECDIAAEAEIRQWWLAEHCVTSQRACGLSAEDGDFFQRIQSRVATVKVKLGE